MDEDVVKVYQRVIVEDPLSIDEELRSLEEEESMILLDE
jgi:hypothetical protein